VRALIRRKVRGLADEIRIGKLGDLIAIKRGGGGKKIMLVAHMDEIGLMVTHVDKRGYARVAPLGGVFPLYTVGARVRFADGRLGCWESIRRRISAKPLRWIKSISTWGPPAKTIARESGRCRPSSIRDWKNVGDRLIAKSMD